jgi:hypothetical protein
MPWGVVANILDTVCAVLARWVSTCLASPTRSPVACAAARSARSLSAELFGRLIHSFLQFR